VAVAVAHEVQPLVQVVQVAAVLGLLLLEQQVQLTLAGEVAEV
jgi:hypothetical protein